MKAHRIIITSLLAAASLWLSSCSSDDFSAPEPLPESAVTTTFAGAIDLTNLANYAAQGTPTYITRDNGHANPVTDAGATLGRVLFYDRNLSVDSTVACASCHRQAFAFSDDAQASTGIAGETGRHSMRLVNARFANEVRFFWDERATSLEDQTTRPIQDHTEMGFSGANGDPSFDDLIDRLEGTGYYQELFTFVYGDADVTEARVQTALAQFVRSIESFDSRYDAGRTVVPNDGPPFPNFTPQENQGKMLFLAPPMFDQDGVRVGGGLGCAGCHRPPEFDIDPNSRNNGLVRAIGGGTDTTVTRSPSLRDLFNPDGFENGPRMHTGDLTINQVLDHYNQITLVENLDQRLMPGGNPQNLAITPGERAAVIAFLHTLTGRNIYDDEKWSNPFPESTP